MSEAPSPAVTRRHEFVLLFDVTNGNPNGDPDAGNRPRLDPETGCGLVSDVAIKRRIRNYVALARGECPGHVIYMRDGATLNNEHLKARLAITPDLTAPEDLRRLPRGETRAREITRWMCANYWDIRTFGAVMTTGVNAGQVRGPVQLTFARSIEPIIPLELTITRIASMTDRDPEDRGQTIGRKHIVPYALYRAHGFVSAPLASHPAKGTGFSEADLDLLFEALANMFEHDRSAARGEMATRLVVVFRHASALGNARAQDLFGRVVVHRSSGEDRSASSSEPLAPTWTPARRFEDYRVAIDRNGLPEGIEVTTL